jgi:hypothetical protein
MELTKDWQPYNGDYQKKMQDIKLKNGDIVYFCWPNAGEWGVWNASNNPKHYGQSIKNSEVAEVRLTHVKYWT